MNAAAVLLAPWRSSHRSMQWIMACLLVLCAVGLGALLKFGSAHNAAKSLAAVAVYCFGLFYVWAFWLPTLLLLAVDARRLRLAGVQHTAAVSIFTYAGLSLLPPCALLVLFGIDPRAGILVVGLTICGGLLFALLPRYISMWLGLMPAAVLAIKHHLAVAFPALNDPRWEIAGSCLLAALLVLCILRWRQLLSVEHLPSGLSGPMVTQFRSNAWGFGRRQSSSQLIRQIPDWLQPLPDLRKTGPHWPIASLQMLLGRSYMPQTWLSRLRQFAWATLILACVAIIMSIAGSMDDLHRILSNSFNFATLLLPWILLSAAIGFVMAPTQNLYQRWYGSGTELPLLALLPGLGEAACARRQLLRATLTRPLAGQLLLLLLTLLIAKLWLGMHLRDVLCIAFVELGCTGIIVVAALTIFGNRVPSGFWVAVLIVIGSVLATLSAFIPLLAGGRHPWESAAAVETGLIAGWLVFGVVLFALGHRGWRGFVQRPHPFLPNGG